MNLKQGPFLQPMRNRKELFVPGIVKPEGMPGGYIVSAWKRARADVHGNIPPAEKNAVK